MPRAIQLYDYQLEALNRMKTAVSSAAGWFGKSGPASLITMCKRAAKWVRTSIFR